MTTYRWSQQNFSRHRTPCRRSAHQSGFNQPFLIQKKCKFAYHKLRVLGYMVGKDGFEMDRVKVEKILRWPTPTSLEPHRAESLRQAYPILSTVHPLLLQGNLPTNPVEENGCGLPLGPG
ncbi:uncharacterized protein BYT42DRAFT_368715 [Radiomyces spectabilis]|uniref:uncharacterized protein n=1 Tax=Radiomyces spectabilis TaxID=64574 RepID=UPI00221F29AE|nr:uncharacterized protein BYT42DRAFT_368715 [Radiomyces spectabilis]KAI8375946.1 hypothetical protein BYT42DRAFT_368715 [Radiomyces spectabilis]